MKDYFGNKKCQCNSFHDTAREQVKGSPVLYISPYATLEAKY